MNLETDRLIRQLDLEHSSALEISGENGKVMGFIAIVLQNSPTYDVCSHVLDDQFDIIIAEQVLEPLLWPYRAVRNVFQMLSPKRSAARYDPISDQDSQSPRGLLAMDGSWNSRFACGGSISIASRPDHGAIGHVFALIGGSGPFIVLGCIRSRMNRTIQSLSGR
jgi:hypothetical protein